MGVDYHYCRVCRDSYPDCGDNSVWDCESCNESLCDNCLRKHNDGYDNVIYWNAGEPGIMNKDEEILKEFCPLCTPKEIKDES